MKILFFFFYFAIFHKKVSSNSSISIENFTNNSLIDKTYEDLKIESNITKRVSCLSKFLSYSLKKTLPISFYTAQNKFSSPKNDIIYKSLMDSDLPLYILSGNLNSKAIYTLSDYSIISIENPGALEYDNEPELLYLCADDCSLIVVILTTPYLDEDSFLADVLYLIQILWKRKLHDVIVTGAVGEEFLLAKSMNFRPNETCTPSEPKIMGTACTSEDSYKDLANVMFEKMELRNCTMKISYFVEEPYTSLTNNNEVSGIEIVIITALSEQLNFQMEYDKITLTNEADYYKELLAKLNTGSQIVIGGLSWYPLNYSSYTHAYDVSNYF